MDHPRRPGMAALGPRLYASLSAPTAPPRMPLAGDSAIVVERLDSPAPTAGEWDALATRLGAAPFMRPEWGEAWADAFAPGRLTLLAARRGSELAGVLPLHRARGRVIAGTANAHTPLGGSLADGPDAARELADALLSEGHARADFAYTDPADPVLTEL